MKTKLTIYFALILAGTFSFKTGNTQTLVQFWDFNQIRPITGSGGDSLGTTYSYANTAAVDSAKGTWPLTPAYSKVAGAKIVYYRPNRAITKYVKHDSILDGVGPGGDSTFYDYSSNKYPYFTKSDSSFAEVNGFVKARNPSDSCEFWLYIPTTGCTGISLQYAISQSSAKGATYNVFSYSTNGGTSWKNLTTAMDTFNIGGKKMPDTLQVENPITVNSNWYPVQINFSSDPAVNNNPNFILRFRLTSYAVRNDTLGSGNDRYDNFAVWATTFTGIDEVSNQGSAYSVFPNPANNTITLAGEYQGKKVISIYNVVGQEMSTIEQEAKQTKLNVSNLTSGVYFINVKETETGNNYTLKFVKE